MFKNFSNAPLKYAVENIDAEYPANITNFENNDVGSTISNVTFNKWMDYSRWCSHSKMLNELNIIKLLAAKSKEKLKSQVSDSLPKSFEFYSQIIASMNANMNNFNKDSTILVVGNLEILFVVVFYLKYIMRFKNWNQMVTFVTDSIIAKGYAEYHYLVPTGNIRIYEKLKDFLGDDTVPHFDFSITNPPYSSNLHLKFLDKLIDITDIELKMIHPARWLYAQKSGTVKNAGNLIKDKLQNYTIDFEMFNGNITFGIEEEGYCSITTINKLKPTKKVYIVNSLNSEIVEFDNIFDVNPQLNTSESYKTLINKIKSSAKINNTENEIHKNNNGSFNINLVSKNGGLNTNINIKEIVTPKFYKFLTKKHNTITNAPLTTSKGNEYQWINFANKETASNALWYYSESKFAQMCLMIFKVNADLNRGELRYVPFFDFSKITCDQDIYTELNLTTEEIELIESTVDAFRNEYA